MEPRARQLLHSRQQKITSCWHLIKPLLFPSTFKRAGLSLMNKKPLRVIDLYSLITCACSLAMTVASSTAHGPKWQRTTWWAQSNQGHKCLWISTPLERRRGYCDTTNCDSLNDGISCGNTESPRPHRASNICTSSAKALYSHVIVVKTHWTLLFHRPRGWKTIKVVQLVTCC